MSLKTSIGYVLCAMALAYGTPAAAQGQHAGEEERVFDLALSTMVDSMATMFPDAEPLDLEQVARLPAAAAIVDIMVPTGTYATIMEVSASPMLEGMTAGIGSGPLVTLLAASNLTDEELEQLDEKSLLKMRYLIDPLFTEKQELVSSAMGAIMSRMADRTEPIFKAGLARAYATRFDDEELERIAGFFRTPAGSKFASQSVLIGVDPQVMGVMRQAFPLMLDELKPGMEKLRTQIAELPPIRTADEMSDSDRQFLAELLGVDPEDLDLSVLGQRGEE